MYTKNDYLRNSVNYVSAIVAGLALSYGAYTADAKSLTNNASYVRNPVTLNSKVSSTNKAYVAKSSYSTNAPARKVLAPVNTQTKPSQKITPQIIGSANNNGSMVGVGVSIPLDYMTDEIEDVPKDTKNDLENRGYFPRSFVGTVMAINPYGKKQALVEGEAQIDSYSRKVNVGDTLGATVSAAYKGITKPVFRVAGLLGGGRSYAPGRFIENINEKGLVRIVDFVAATPGELQKVIFVPTEGMKDPHWYHHIPILGYILPRDVTYKNISKVDGKKDIDVVLSDGSASGWVNAAVVAKTLAPLALMGVGGGSGSSSAGNNNADSTQNSDENKETPVIPPVIPPVQDGGRDERTGGDDVTSR